MKLTKVVLLAIALVNLPNLLAQRQIGEVAQIRDAAKRDLLGLYTNTGLGHVTTVWELLDDPARLSAFRQQPDVDAAQVDRLIARFEKAGKLYWGLSGLGDLRNANVAPDVLAREEQHLAALDAELDHLVD
ncbi:MAG TPA: hypothetical protein VJJ83_00580 [Candidatus Babeliales bacterium]|nr:hypothetical protein [Candidatus Babeliales bacterium]